jgi:hypothetical protein
LAAGEAAAEEAAATDLAICWSARRRRSAAGEAAAAAFTAVAAAFSAAAFSPGALAAAADLAATGGRLQHGGLAPASPLAEEASPSLPSSPVEVSSPANIAVTSQPHELFSPQHDLEIPPTFRYMLFPSLAILILVGRIEPPAEISTVSILGNISLEDDFCTTICTRVRPPWLVEHPSESDRRLESDYTEFA